jgi:hypothetical protein
MCSEFGVAVLQCGQCVLRWWRSDRLEATEGVSDNVVLSRNVTDVSCELGDKV